LALGLRAGMIAVASERLDIKRFNKNKAVDRLTQFIRAEKSYFRSEINPVDMYRPFHVTPKLNNKRVIAQSGSFIIFGLGIGPLYPKTIQVTNLAVLMDKKQRIRE
jgi:hypothetical protein